MSNLTTCPVCETDFIKPSKKPNQKFCCRECWRKSRLNRVVQICKTCDEEFSVYEARSSADYCSWECYTAKTSLTCKYCGNRFKVKRSAARRRMTCSRSCLMKLRAKEQRAPHQDKQRSAQTRKRVSDGLRRYYSDNPDGHWNFKGVGYNERRGNFSEWQLQRKAARTRDQYTCQRCGISETNLNQELSVHHIVPFRCFDDWREANRLSNLICFCQSCHMIVERLIYDDS